MSAKDTEWRWPGCESPATLGLPLSPCRGGRCEKLFDSAAPDRI